MGNIIDAKKIFEQQPQTQASLKDQLIQLFAIANQAGLYDAADWMAKKMEEQKE